MRRGNPDVHQTPTIQVIERMFSLIDVLASREDSMSLKDISEQTGLHPSTAHRILNDLTIGRFVDRPEAGSYRLGMRLLGLGNLVKARLSVRDAALVPMRDLHRLIQQPVNLSVRQGETEYEGTGTSRDIIEASALAWLDVANRLLRQRRGTASEALAATA